jgi:tetratricopeptide (TPR) repeat protein
MEKREPSGNRKVVPIAEAKQRRHKKALRESRAEGMASIPDDPDVVANFTMIGNMDLIEGNFEDAVEPFSRALAIEPDDVDARSGRGRAYQALGEHALALADFDRAVKLEPGEARHHLNRARALAMLGRLRQAVRACSRSIELAPGNAGAYYTRAVYRSHVDEEDPGVRADLDRAVELAPDQLPYLRARIDRLTNGGEYDLALADLDRAVTLAPDNAELHVLRGQCLLDVTSPWYVDTKGEELDEAAQCRGAEAALVALAQALELAPKEGQILGRIHYAIVRARETLPDVDAFLAALDQAIVVMPDDIGLLSVRAGRRRQRGDVDGAAADRKRLEEVGYQV